MRNIWTISKREFKHYYGSPLAYVVAFIIFLILGNYLLCQHCRCYSPAVHWLYIYTGYPGGYWAIDHYPVVLDASNHNAPAG